MWFLPETKFRMRKLPAGTHYKIIGDTLERHKKFWAYGKQLYIDLTKEYPDKFERMG